MKNSMNKKGFTLVELLIVLVIMGMLIGIGYTYFSSSTNDLKKDTRILYNNLIFIRMKAVQLNSTAYLQFDTTNNSYTLNYDNVTKTVNLSSDVEFGDGGHGSLSNHKVGFGSTNPPKATFYPNGGCMPSGSVYLKTTNSNNYVFQISVSMAGNVIIKQWNGSIFE